VETIEILTPATGPVLTLPLIKSHLRVTHDAEDDLIQLYADAATRRVEEATGLALRSTALRWTLDRVSGRLVPPRQPVRSVESITYRDPYGVTRPIETEAIDVIQGQPGRIATRSGCWPATADRAGAVVVDYTAGFGPEATDVPAPLRLAVAYLAAQFYEFREPIGTGAELPLTVRFLIESCGWRVYA
jgi:uncharacterized phiE125 gp8 family phage protein